MPVFQNALNNAARRGIVDQNSREAMDWFRKSLRKTTVSPTRIMKEERANLVNSWTNVGPGRLYFVSYDPKWKKELPYYDLFPAMIPIERKKDRLLALNLHYLPPTLRAKLLDGLFETLSNDRFDEKTKMQINYGMLKEASNLKYFKPCVKSYLGSHFRSRFLKIPASQWTMAVFLPTEQFQKATNKAVWADSRRIIRG